MTQHREFAARCGLVGAALLGAASAGAQALSAADLYARLSPSVWVVRTFDKEELPLMQGSAVVIGPQALVTNCHVLRKAKRVEVSHEKTVWPATLELWDTEHDICQLKAPGVAAAAVPLGDAKALRVGQAAYALGSPAGQELTLSAGLVSALRYDDAKQLVAIQTSAPTSHGSSGGGLFNDQGELIGITSATIGADTQNLNLARPVDMVRALPQRHAAARQNTGPVRAEGSSDAVARLAGQWAGQYRCGAYMGSGQVPHPNPWNAAALMTVNGDGTVSITRGGDSYSETVTGTVQSDLSVSLKGQGADRQTPQRPWNMAVTGRFDNAGKQDQFTGRASLTSWKGELFRDCTIVLNRR